MVLLGVTETYYIKFGFCGVQGFYEYINRASILEYMKEFLTHEDPNIRAKTCSALGNMCRHSSYFYSPLVSNEQSNAFNGLHYINTIKILRTSKH